MKKTIFAVLLILVLAGGAFWVFRGAGLVIDPFVATYVDNCSSCHGENLDGVPEQGPALLDTELLHGDSVTDIGRSIAEGFPAHGVHGFAEELSDEEIRSLAIYIAERRVDRLFTDFRVDAPVAIPKDVVTSDKHDFRVEVVTDQLHPLPFSIAPLPDGRILVSEKTRGLRIVASDGSVSDLITGTPEVFDDGWEFIIAWGHGWLLDVALHPDYANNGWIYLHHTERCMDCSVVRKSVNRVVRGRIRDGHWVDEEVIWAPGSDHYSLIPDVGAGGRLAFDDKGYLYISVGVKGSSNFDGIQNLERPAGKIHRVHDDGRIPEDNPFVKLEGAFPSTWTYGHRSPQGLEFNLATGKLWSTEMGPRGGDELNLLLPGRNYGWPLHSKGLNYDGTAIDYGYLLDIDVDLNDIEQPIVDLTPAPAVSSFVFYQGEQFPGWNGHALVGSLKGSELYRIVVDDDRFTYSEVLLKQLARIRDVEVGADGNVYLLLEHTDGGQIVRLVPVAESH